MKLNWKGSGLGTLVPGLCCFGLLNVLLGLLGLTAAIAWVNNYGDYIFFPLFALFGTIFIKQLLTWKKHWVTYLISLIVIGIMIFFMKFGFSNVALIIGGVLVGLLILKYVKK